MLISSFYTKLSFSYIQTLYRVFSHLVSEDFSSSAICYIHFVLIPNAFYNLLPFSLGGENLAVAQNTYSVAWFKGKELNFVFGLQLSISRVVSECKKVYVNVATNMLLLSFCELNEKNKTFPLFFLLLHYLDPHAKVLHFVLQI